MHHQFRCTHLCVAARDRKLHTLVLANGATKNVAFAGIIAGFFDEPFGVTNTFGGNEDTLGIHTRQNVTETFAFFANQSGSRYPHIVKEYFSR